MSNVPLSDDSRTMFQIRWRGRQEGPYTAKVIEEKLASNQIGLLHEISHNGQWVSLRDYLAERAADIRAIQQAQVEEEERQRIESERQAKELEEQQKSELLAEQQRVADQAEAARQRQIMQSQPSMPVKSSGSSGLRNGGIFLLLGGLIVTAFFFFGYDTSVESGVGRVNNIGLMADRQNGILIGLGLAIVGTILLVIGSQDKN